ncbi:MAG: hypothetical protein R2854_10590 [Caldilineaceae bacterium]
MSEADEAAALARSATVTAAEAEAAVLAAHPGASVHKTALENENGYLVWRGAGYRRGCESGRRQRHHSGHGAG